MQLDNTSSTKLGGFYFGVTSFSFHKAGLVSILASLLDECSLLDEQVPLLSSVSSICIIERYLRFIFMFDSFLYRV